METMIYICCLVAGVVFVLGVAIFGHAFGGDGHVDGSGGHAEAGADSSDSPGMSFFSPLMLASFIGAFGAIGLILSQFESTKPAIISTPLSLLGGGLLAGALVSILRKLIRSGDSSSEGQVANLIGHSATIITPIPAGGVGEIAYVQSGTRYTAPARGENGTLIPAGTTVNITRIVGSQFFVAPVQASK